MAITPTHHWTTLATMGATATFPSFTSVVGDLYVLVVYQEASNFAEPAAPVFTNGVLNWTTKDTIVNGSGGIFKGRTTIYEGIGTGASGQIGTTLVPQVGRGWISGSLVGWHGDYRLSIRKTMTRYHEAGDPVPFELDLTPISSLSVVDAFFGVLGWDFHLPAGGAWLIPTLMLSETKLGQWDATAKPYIARQWDGTHEPRSRYDNSDVLGPMTAMALYVAAEIGPESIPITTYTGRHTGKNTYDGRHTGKTTYDGRC